MLDGLDVEKGHIDFRGRTVINTSNESLAREIDEKHGKKGSAAAYVVHDEQLSKARTSESYDIVHGKRGPYVHAVHNYTFTMIKPKPLTIADKVKRFISGRGLFWFFWYWDTINPKYNREIGVRIFGLEFKKEFPQETL